MKKETTKIEDVAIWLFSNALTIAFVILFLSILIKGIFWVWIGKW